ncbi:MAG TPA: hypothetical protein VJT50_03150 [Pyrinomonadaceae bacterium]|nr:hypothetical protein [Pyrinomonadaceae bacterium]
MKSPFNPTGGRPGAGAPANLPSIQPVALNSTLPARSVAPPPDVLGQAALEPPGFQVNVQSMVMPAHTPARRLKVAPTPAVSNEMPEILVSQLRDLEDWAIGNKKDSRNDAIRFWALKIPAIIASVAAGIFAHYKWDAVPLFAGAIASACVLIDGVNPGGALRNAHYKAFYELRELEAEMVTNWRTRSFKATTDNAKLAIAAQIIKESETKRAKISKDLKRAETVLAEKH